MSITWTDNHLATVNNGVKIIVHGLSGAGKTMLLATAPSPLIISAEKGMLSLKRLKQKIPIAEIESIDDLWTLREALETKDYRSHFKTIGIDSMSEVGELLLADLKPKFKDPRQAYGELLDRCLEVVKSFRSLEGYNIVFIFKTELTQFADGSPRYAPNLPGKKAGLAMPYLTDEVFYLGVASSEKGSYRYLRTQPNAEFEAKDRSGVLDEIERPDLGYVIQKIVT